MPRGYTEEEPTFAERGASTIYLTDGVRARKLDDGYIVEALASDETWSGNGVGLVQKKTVTLNNAQIKASPTPTPIIIVPPTETLGGSDFPSSLPVPVTAFAFLDARGGAYGDISVGDIQLSFGINMGVGAAISAQRSSTGHVNLPIAAAATRQGFGFYCLMDSDMSDGYLEDNSLVVWINNGSTPLSGGDPTNSMTVTVHYARWLM